MTVEHSCFDGPRGSSRAKGGFPGLGLSMLVAGMAASAITFASMSAGAGSSDAGWSAARLIESLVGTTSSDIVGTISSETGEDRAPTRSHAPGLRLASLDTDVAAGAAFAASAGQIPLPATQSVFFDDRFHSSFGERLESFDDRFGAANAGARERTVRTQRSSMPAPGSMPAAEPGRDSQARADAPKRPNARVAMLAPADHAGAPPASPGAGKVKPTYPTDLRGDAILESLGSRTAIYDITARVVYLPDGTKLEAHSGLGEHMDDPRSIGVKNKGATPPNIYELSLRERRFHGVRAIRLNPVDPDRMLGRDGILAHSYLLGPDGSSNGCVSINNYGKFLDAFLNGDIERIVVVERLVDAPTPATAVGWLTQRVKALFKSS
jgi:Protein of unknown function (DUF2778)